MGKEYVCGGEKKDQSVKHYANELKKRTFEVEKELFESFFVMLPWMERKGSYWS